MAERLARELSERLGEDAVTAHHGSLSKEKRLDAESRLKAGELKALVATASLELGIDIGHVDLVCQIGSPHRIATFLQRVGRSGHTIAGLPKGRLFAVLARRSRRVRGAPASGTTRRARCHRVARRAARRAGATSRRRSLERRLCRGRALRSGPTSMAVSNVRAFDLRRRRADDRRRLRDQTRPTRRPASTAMKSTVACVAVAASRMRAIASGRRDSGSRRLSRDSRSRRHARRHAQRGLRDREQRRRCLSTRQRLLADPPGWSRASCASPTHTARRRRIPFWLGEAPGAQRRVVASGQRSASVGRSATRQAMTARRYSSGWPSTPGCPREAAEQVLAYLAEGRRALGVLPTQETLVLERFFDESGGMQLVLHAPFGSRVNKAWGLALRKRFLPSVQFRAAGGGHRGRAVAVARSAALVSARRTSSATCIRRRRATCSSRRFSTRPCFRRGGDGTRPSHWRFHATVTAGRFAPQLQRMQADDLMAAVFPDAAACLENIPGDREIPDHPLVTQSVRDCLQEAMDFEALSTILERIHHGEIQCVARDTTEPSPLSTRSSTRGRTRFWTMRRSRSDGRMPCIRDALENPAASGDLGALDASAISRVCDEERPDPRDSDELHDDSACRLAF